MADNTFSLELTRQSGYRMKAQPGREEAPAFIADETPPLGAGTGATPTELLGGAVGGCLSASLLFCLEKSRIPVNGITTRVDGTVERNDEGRLRVAGLRVVLDVDVVDGSPGRIERCLGMFENFCTVTQSVRQAIPIEVEVTGTGIPEPAARADRDSPGDEPQ